MDIMNVLRYHGVVGGTGGKDKTPPPPIINLTGVYGNNSVSLSWSNPSDSDFVGVRIVRKTGSYPTSQTDGTIIYNGTATSFIDNTVTNGTQYFYRAFTYDYDNNFNVSTSGQETTGSPIASQPISNLPVGSKVLMKSKYQVENETPQRLAMIVADKNKSGYPANSVTLLAESGLDVRCFDSFEPSNTDTYRQSLGSNRYLTSNIKQWLNKSGNNWFVAQNSYDKPPNTSYLISGTGTTAYDDNNGFLTNFDSTELSNILATTFNTLRPSLDGASMQDSIIDKIFLLSSTELGSTNAYLVDEGSKIALFNTASNLLCYPSSQAVTNTLGAYRNSAISTSIVWATRTPASNSSSIVCVGANGVVGNSQSSANGSGYFIRPALNINNTVNITATPNAQGYYEIV